MSTSVFGEPRKGVHAIRFMNIAVVDVLFTILFAVLIARVGSFSLAATLVGCFLAGVVAHRWFDVRTTVDRFLFP